MTRLLRVAAVVGTAIVLMGCASQDKEIRRKCATAADPAACAQAQRDHIRAADDDALEKNGRYGGSY